MKLKGVLLVLFLSTITIVSVQPLVILHLGDSSHGEVDSVDEIAISQNSQKAIRGQFF